MIAKFIKKDSALRPGARVVDGKLVMVFPAAVNPVVWQMEFDKAVASALEVVENAQTGRFTLELRTLKGETTDIASFTAKEDALAGLMAAARALENAQGRVRPAANQDLPAPRRSAFRKYAGPLAAILVIIFVLALLNTMAGMAPQDGRLARMEAASGPAALEPGVPLSADAFLNRQ